jgi:hypothetical protein
MGDERGRSRRLVAVLALERSDGARAFVRFAGGFLANGSQPAKVRQTHVPKAERTKRPNASTSRSRSRTQFAALNAHGFTAERRPRIRRIPTAIPWQTRRVTNRPSEDPGPCRRCAAALSCSADALTCIKLGSHAKSGPRLRRLPQTAVPCGRRNRASLSPTHALEPTAWRRGSAHPDPRLRGWNRVASPRRVGRIPAGFRRPMATRSVTNRQSDDPGPCRRCAVARSSGADAPTYLSLGSHARSGLRMRCSPRRAVPCGHRNGATLSSTDASNPAALQRGSTHPDHRMRGWIRLLTAGDHRNANGWGLLRRGTCTRQRTHWFIGVKPDLAHALRSGYRQLCPFAPAGRARIARQAWAAHRWAIGIRVLRSTNVNGMCVGPC